MCLQVFSLTVYLQTTKRTCKNATNEIGGNKTFLITFDVFLHPVNQFKKCYNSYLNHFMQQGVDFD